MEIEQMPFVAIIGGLWQFKSPQLEAARAVGERIGEELAKAGFGLVVYFSDDASLEPHVVSGYAKALPSGSGRIRVRFAESQRGQVKFKEELTMREIFEIKLFPGQDWEMPFYRSLAEEDSVDAVLLLGGATSTLIAGQIALARMLPTLAVDEFGGSAAKIWNQAQSYADLKHDSWGTTNPSKLVQQLKGRCSARAAKRKELARRLADVDQIKARRNHTVYGSGAFLFLLLLLFFGMVYTPWPSAYPFIMFIGLVAAGATGGVLRGLVLGGGESDPWVSFLLGSVAGLVVGIAYLIPQWVGAPGVLTPKTAVVSATDKIQFASAMLVAISAGVGFDTVFNRLQKQAENVAVGPPGSE